MVALLFNIALLLALSIFFATYPFKQLKWYVSHEVFIGLIVGLIGLLIMFNPFHLAQGVVYDSRSILIVVSGMVLGSVPTVVASFMMACLRLYLGGVGLLAGLATIVASACVGIVWHRFRFTKILEKRGNLNLEFYLVGLFTHVLMLGCQLLLPDEVQSYVLSVMTFPILLLYPVGTYLLALLLFNQAYRIADINTLEKSERLFKTMFEQAPIGMSLTNLETGKIGNINQSYLDMLGYRREEVIGHRWSEFSHPEDRELSDQTTTTIKEGKQKSLSLDKRFIKKDGTILWANLSLSSFTSAETKDLQSLCMTVDITERKLAEEKILNASRHDALTDLYNRVEFERIVGSKDLEDKLPLTVMFADVNRLRIINEAFGREEGNLLLQRIADSFKQYMPKQALLFRVGGDEFALLVPSCPIQSCETVLQKLKEAIRTMLVQDSVVPSMSFGLSEVNAEQPSISEAIKLAEREVATHKLLNSSDMQGKAVYAIINTLHEKNKREESHSRRVSELGEKLARAYGLSERSCSELRIIGLLHDIGKIAISESILNKEGELTPQEWKEMQRHSEIGYRILSSVENMTSFAQYVLAHHEQYDGSGYPKGLQGEEIPLQSRMIAIADAYDAMTAFRTYRNSVSGEEAAREIKRCSGTQFDPHLARLFITEVLSIDYETL